MFWGLKWAHFSFCLMVFLKTATQKQSRPAISICYIMICSLWQVSSSRPLLSRFCTIHLICIKIYAEIGIINTYIRYLCFLLNTAMTLSLTLVEDLDDNNSTTLFPSAIRGLHFQNSPLFLQTGYKIKLLTQLWNSIFLILQVACNTYHHLGSDMWLHHQQAVLGTERDLASDFLLIF